MKVHTIRKSGTEIIPTYLDSAIFHTETTAAKATAEFIARCDREIERAKTELKEWYSAKDLAGRLVEADFKNGDSRTK